VSSAVSHITPDLVSRLAAGEESAFREIFENYKAPFHSVAWKITRSTDLAEEIVQEVFVAIWEKRQLIAAAQNPTAYIFTILHNSIYLHFRKLAQERKLKKTLSVQVDEAANFVDEFLYAKENRAFLDSIIRQLPPQQQLIYKLSKQGGLSREEIAARLQLSPNTVRNHLAQAVLFVREGLKKGASVIIWAIIWQHF